jgi:hypothetical protein
MVMWARLRDAAARRVITGRVPLLDPSAYSLIRKPEEQLSAATVARS